METEATVQFELRLPLRLLLVLEAAAAFEVELLTLETTFYYRAAF